MNVSVPEAEETALLSVAVCAPGFSAVMVVPAGTAPPGEVTSIPTIKPDAGFSVPSSPATIMFCRSAEPFWTLASIVRLATEASSMFLSSICNVEELILTVAPSTLKSPKTRSSPSTVRSFGVVTLNEESVSYTHLRAHET